MPVCSFRLLMRRRQAYPVRICGNPTSKPKKLQYPGCRPKDRRPIHEASAGCKKNCLFSAVITAPRVSTISASACSGEISILRILSGFTLFQLKFLPQPVPFISETEILRNSIPITIFLFFSKISFWEACSSSATSPAEPVIAVRLPDGYRINHAQEE